jgi:CheY-like chemotaxis protein
MVCIDHVYYKAFRAIWIRVSKMANSYTRVAVVDDDVSMRKALARLLHVSGYSVLVCASGIELLECIESFQPHCLILDLQMPEMSGFEILRRLAHMPADIATIVITGNDSPEVQRRCAELGASAYFAKPISGNDLLAAIKST